MQDSPTYIHYRCQFHLLGPDTPGQHFDRELFQKLFFKLNEKPVLANFDEFSYHQDGCEMGTKQGKKDSEGRQAFSKLVYNNDLLTLVEEWASIDTGDYGGKITKILTAWFNIFPQTVCVAQKCCVRALIQPNSVNDSRQFLGDRVLKIGETLKDHFKGMPSAVGFSLGCPRMEGESGYILDANIKSWREGKSVWIEVTGQKGMPQPLNPANLNKGRDIFDSCVNFLEKEVLSFLRVFDKDEQKEQGEKT